MTNGQLGSIVSKSEADALKELIFRRARERAESLNTEVQSSYTSTVKNDIMDIARDSFKSSNNPFSINESSVIKNSVNKEAELEAEVNNSSPEIGFQPRHAEAVQAQLKIKNKDISYAETEKVMAEARDDLSRKQSFMGALNFLNSHATISLVNKHGKSFEAIA